ncbi:hypothetical protein [Wenzhouxiangella sp. EGI_FJ10305]|uniref:hypothetical protein n=1 Tax=Wenzhouxiangella sp. EGI_FJ10305 TaxID=3243768 RepID=UPI0035E1C09C
MIDSSQAPAAQADTESGHGSDCHSADAPTGDTMDGSTHDCCETDQPCEHGNCVCTALSPVVPIHGSAAALSAPVSPAWMLATPSPVATTSKLLRPPRA